MYRCNVIFFHGTRRSQSRVPFPVAPSILIQGKRYTPRCVGRVSRTSESRHDGGRPRARNRRRHFSSAILAPPPHPPPSPSHFVLEGKKTRGPAINQD